MQAFKVKEKLMSLPSAQVIFGKLNAVLARSASLVVGPEQTESVPSWATTKRYRAHQLEAERLKAKAEEFAQTLQRGFV
ncbi:MAG: hypothetical protein JSW72_00305 [Candidatus Bathyarchaeota archaeon]|nr:MAG: hypothetical protein JSW72_00305 [Candidatus Bathyarchaeota archaeon]